MLYVKRNSDILEIFRELSRSGLSAEEQIKVLDTLTEDAEKLIASEHKQGNEIRYTEALTKVFKNWQKNNIISDTVKVPN